jgi:hypothetical protein
MGGTGTQEQYIDILDKRLQIPKGNSQEERKKNNVVAKRIRTKGHTMIYKALHLYRN